MLLPLEIIEHIFTFLSEDPNVLLSLALVSRRWTATAQRQLNRRIVISRKGQWARLHKRLRIFPNLRPLIRELELILAIFFDPDKTQHQNLFPCLEKVIFSNYSTTSIEMLYALALDAPTTLRSTQIMINDISILISFGRFLRNHDRWDEIKLIIDVWWWREKGDPHMNLGTPSIGKLTIVEQLARPTSVAFSVLRNTSFRSLDRLNLQLSPVSCSPSLDVHRFGHGSLPPSLLEQLGHVVVELGRFDSIENIEHLAMLFGSAGSCRGMLEVNTFSF